jgi:hypothetical protein
MSLTFARIHFFNFIKPFFEIHELFSINKLKTKGEIMNESCWKGYKQVGMKKKGSRTVPNCVKESRISFAEWVDIRESKEKPFKGYNSKKNHPEGGLKPSYAKKLGIHAGIETKREAERSGGVNKMSKKTQARRKSFCARMCKAGTEKSRNDPNSKQRAALRVWKCKC